MESQIRGVFSARAFVVHCYADFRRDRLYLVGRLEDGRSFAAVEEKFKPGFHVYEREIEKVKRILASLKYEICPPELNAFGGEGNLLLLKFSRYRDYRTAGMLLEPAGVLTPDGDLKVQDAFLIRQYIRGPIEVEGEARPGRLVDLVFPKPLIKSTRECNVNLKMASVDIETDVENGTILAIGISVGNGSVNDESHVRVLCMGESPGPGIFFHPTEVSLLEAFLFDIKKADPDIITGWNLIDFDFPRLAERCAFNRIPFNMGRSMEESKFFPASQDDDGNGKNGGGSRRRSATALVQGRQVLDALRVFRSGPRGFPGGGFADNSSFTLEAAARSVLGEGKLVSSAGGEKIKELKELYHKDPERFGAYCLRDAELVLKILGKTGLWRLTMERACLTGVSLDKAWTSVASFERIYGMELYRLKIAAPPVETNRAVSGAAGGTVLEPLPGLFKNVVVFDFRSLYPTIMLTFNIDPLSHARANSGPGTNGNEKPIVAPNGAAFSREKGILPGLIAGYFAARRRALEAGDEEASFVYKILMNSFYGVLGTPSCRYGRTLLAGSITSFAKKWLMFSRDWFTQKGYRVLYGDTDSLFVETGLGDDSMFEDFRKWGESCSQGLNESLKECVRDEYGLESFMEIRFEKPYRRFMIPPLRSAAAEGRGRAKGYGGYLLDSEGGVSVEVKGMEAVRSDYTQLARRIQMELLEVVFSGCDEGFFKEQVNGILRELRQGKLDGELVYRKRLARSPESYTASTPPQVKAARALGWKNRRGVINYVWTLDGPEPVSDDSGTALPHAALDYDHYAESQVLPAVRSIAAAAGWKAEIFPSPGRDYFRDGQMELGL